MKAVLRLRNAFNSCAFETSELTQALLPPSRLGGDEVDMLGKVDTLGLLKNTLCQQWYHWGTFWKKHLTDSLCERVRRCTVEPLFVNEFPRF